MRLSGLALSLLSGCFGVYAEVATSTLPSASIDTGAGSTATTVSATTIGFNLGADFGSTTKRFALGYASDTATFEGGTTSGAASSSRFDFNVLSLSDRARIRLGLGFAKGDDNGNAFGGVDFTYFLSWKIAVHAFGGPMVMTQSRDGGGSVSGVGGSFRLTLSYYFGDVRPDTMIYIPLDENKDLTGVLEDGAGSIGCTSSRDSNPSSGYAFLSVGCQGRKVIYMQVATGINAMCMSMFKDECNAFTLRLGHAAKATMKKPAPAPVPQPAVAPAPVVTPAVVAPVPTPTPTTDAPPTQDPTSSPTTLPSKP